MNPPELRYLATHEWARLDGDVVTVGITKFAVEQLTEPTFLELPPVGKELKVGQAFGVIESVKSTSDVNSPVAGTVVERNEKLLEDKVSKRSADLTLTDKGFVWGFKEPQRGVEVRYTVTLTPKNEWYEIGEYTLDGKTWTKFIEMTLTRVKE